MQIYTRAAHRQIAIANPSQGDEFIRQLFHLGGVTADNNDLHTVIMIHMNMG